MLWHGLVGDPNTMRPRQSFAVLRLFPSEGFYSVLFKGIHLQAHGSIVIGSTPYLVYHI